MNFEDKTLVLTGATGFIGSHLRRRLKELNFARVVLISRHSDLEPSPNEVVIEGELSVLSRASFRKASVDQIDYLVHLAGFAPKEGPEADGIEPNLQDNVLATHRLLQSLPNDPVRIVFASTLDVYSPVDSDAVLTERSPVGDCSFYGHSKLLCEALVRVYARSRGIAYTILRYGHIYGSGEEAYKKLIPTTIRRLLVNEAPVVYGDGTPLRDFLHVSDAVEATIRALIVETPTVNAVNLVRGESATINEVVQKLVDLTAFQGSIQYVPGNGVVRSLRFDNRLMKELFGEWEFIPLDAGLAEEVKSFRL